jgi:hypothetical protein
MAFSEKWCTGAPFDGIATNNLCGNVYSKNENILVHTSAPKYYSCNDNSLPPTRRYNLRPRKVTSYYEESFVYTMDKQDADYVPYVHISGDTNANMDIITHSSPKTENILTFITELQSSHLEEEKNVHVPQTYKWVLRSSLKSNKKNE